MSSDSDSDWSASSAGSASSHADSDDSGANTTRVLHDNVAFVTHSDSVSLAVASRQSSQPPNSASMQQPQRQRRARRVSHYSAVAPSDAIGAYAEALRMTTPHRESISTSAAKSSSNTSAQLPEAMRHRHRESKKRVALAERTQQLLLRAHELSAAADDLPLWLHARVIPPHWRRQMLAHITPIHVQMTFCQAHVLHAWQLLLPPFDAANLSAVDARAALFERSVQLLDAALAHCQQLAIDGERTAACGFLQRWYRQQLAKRGFYTRTVHMHRRDRGLIPGLFDSTPGRSKLTVDRTQQTLTLEFPVSLPSSLSGSSSPHAPLVRP